MHHRGLITTIAATLIGLTAGCTDDASDARPSSAPSTTAPRPSTTANPPTTTQPGSAAAQSTSTTEAPRIPHSALRLRDDSVELVRFDGRTDPSRIQMYLTTIGQTLDFPIQRTDYLTPPSAELIRTIDGTATSTRIPDSVEFGEGGFRGIGSLAVLDSAGGVLTATELNWCPADEERVDLGGSVVSSHDPYCSWYGPLGFGTRWGLADGWGSQLSMDNADAIDLPDGTYRASVELDASFARLIGATEPSEEFELTIRPATEEELAEYEALNPEEEFFEEPPQYFDANGEPVVIDPDAVMVVFDAEGNEVRVDGYGNEFTLDEFGDLVYDEGSDSDSTYFGGAYLPLPGTPVEPQPHPSRTPVPGESIPDGALLPDLRVLPSYGIFTVAAPDGRDFLAFNATTWNAGHGTLMIEGFRRPGQAGMDAYQILLDGTTQTAALPAGSLEYHKGDGHDHWHLLDFGRYELTDADRNVVRDSGKQAWCLALTDNVDMSPMYVDLADQVEDLGDACGSSDDIWSRQAIPPGYGDTYSPAQTGQVFDITALANGDYYVKLTANPDNVLAEEDLTNNTSFRWVILGGEPGARTVRVPPYQGIETEGA